MFDPILPMEESTRRRERIASMLESRDLECLVVFGLYNREQYHTYLTNCRTRNVAVFDYKGDEVIELGSSRYEQDNHEFLQRQGMDLWMDGLSLGPSFSDQVAEEIRRLGYEESRIGVVGLEGYLFNADGWIPHRTWESILEALPNATFEDVTDAYSRLMLVKSEAELELARKAGRVGEKVTETILSETKTGARENQVYASGVETLYRENGTVNHTDPLTPFIMHSAPDGENLSGGEPPWTYRPYSPRVLEPGDVLETEIFSSYGQIETQQQLTVALSPVHEDVRRLGEIARESLEAGLDAIEAGVTFLDVCEAMEEPILESEATWSTNLIHTVSPLYAISGFRTEGDDGEAKHTRRAADIELEEGMLLAIEPHAVLGERVVTVGGTAIVRKNGVEQLNELGNRLHVL